MIEETRVDCPYCGEIFVTLVDHSAGSQTYVEDCQVCCRPIEFHVQLDAAGGLLGVETHRDDE